MSEKKKLTDAELLNVLSTIACKQIDGNALTPKDREQLDNAMEALKTILKEPKKSIKEALIDLAIRSKDVLVNVKDSAQFKLNSFKKTRKQKKKVKLEKKLESYES